MISIVICSRTKLISDNLIKNIAETIGVEFELVAIDNSNNKYSIFQAYNIGLKKSKSNIICFLHDDIHIITQNWGNVLIEIFEKNKNIGLIGIAGAKSKTKMPSAWWDCADEDICININQYLRNGTKIFWHKGFERCNLEDVVTIDGVFMVAKKDSSISFSTKLKGFHNYDLNLSFEYQKKGYRVVVTKDILLDHFSNGTIDKSWYISSFHLYKLYYNILPLNKSNFVPIKNYEFSNGSKFIDNLLKHKLKWPAFYLWIKLLQIKPKSKFHFYFFKSLFQ